MGGMQAVVEEAADGRMTVALRFGLAGQLGRVGAEQIVESKSSWQLLIYEMRSRQLR